MSMELTITEPCQTHSDGSESDRLVAFIYLMLRDHVHPGDAEHVAMQLVEAGPYEFTNAHLEGYARSLASYLTSEEDDAGSDQASE